MTAAAGSYLVVAMDEKMLAHMRTNFPMVPVVHEKPYTTTKGIENYHVFRATGVALHAIVRQPSATPCSHSPLRMGASAGFNIMSVTKLVSVLHLLEKGELAFLSSRPGCLKRTPCRPISQRRVSAARAIRVFAPRA